MAPLLIARFSFVERVWFEQVRLGGRLPLISHFTYLPIIFRQTSLTENFGREELMGHYDHKFRNFIAQLNIAMYY